MLRIKAVSASAPVCLPLYKARRCVLFMEATCAVYGSGLCAIYGGCVCRLQRLGVPFLEAALTFMAAMCALMCANFESNAAVYGANADIEGVRRS